MAWCRGGATVKIAWCQVLEWHYPPRHQAIVPRCRGVVGRRGGTVVLSMKELDDTRLLLPRSFSRPTAVYSVQHCREQRRNEDGRVVRQGEVEVVQWRGKGWAVYFDVGVDGFSVSWR